MSLVLSKDCLGEVTMYKTRQTLAKNKSNLMEIFLHNTQLLDRKGDFPTVMNGQS